MSARTVIFVALLLTLAGCGYSPRGQMPIGVWVLKAPLDKATTCVIAGLNAQFPADFNRPYPITHAAQIVSPNAVYEIAPQQNLAPVHAEMYFIRATAEGQTTRLELFAPEGWRDALSQGIARCEATLKA